MGLSVPAAHVVIFIALASAGTLLAGSFTEAFRDTNDARADAVRREQAAVNERLMLASEGYHPEHCKDDGPGNGCQGTIVQESTYANVTNNGSEEILLEDVDVLLDGQATARSSLAVFQIRGNATTNVWLPGETLEIRVDDQGDADVTVVGPHGVKAYRRA